MTTRRLVPRAKYISRVCLGAKVSIQPRGGMRFSSAGPATVADTGFWRSLVPKPFRKENRKKGKGWKSKEWNPATFFVVMFLFIGSMSIQMIALRNQSERYDRQSTVRIGRLREALRKLQNGEEVDVDQLLGNVDDVHKDTDWEEMLKAMESHEHPQSIDREAEVTMRPKAQAQEKPAAMTLPTTRDVVDMDEAPGSHSSTTSSSKLANLGNFF